MIRMYQATGQDGIAKFISHAMTHRGWDGWAFMQLDRLEDESAEVRFIISTEPKIKLATIHLLH